MRRHITPVNTRVQGFIRKIYFEEYRPVKAGDTLLVIEDAEVRVRMENCAKELARYEVLLGQEAVTRQQYDDWMAAGCG